MKRLLIATLVSLSLPCAAHAQAQLPAHSVWGNPTTLQALPQATTTPNVTGLTLSGITGATRCLHVDTSGVVSGTASDCGTATGGITSLTSTGGTLTVTGTTAPNIDLALGHANIWTATQTLSGLTLSGVTGGTSQCLHASTVGVVSGTGSDCGSGGTPALSNTHIFVGNGSNVATDFGTLATFASSGTLTISPTANTTSRGLSILQSGPLSGTTSATAGTNCSGGNPFLAYNYICVDSEGANLIGGATPYFTYGLIVGLITGGANSTGNKNAGEFFLLHSAASSPLATSGIARDEVALVTHASSQASEGGTNTGAGAAGTNFAFSMVAQLLSGATNYFENSATEADCGIQTGASTKHQLCIEAVNAGTTAAALLDGGFVVGAVGGSPGFKHGILFTSLNGGAPIATTGTLIGTDTTGITVAHGVDLSAYTFSSDAFKSPGFLVNGSGVLTSAGLQLNGTAHYAYVTSLGAGFWLSDSAATDRFFFGSDSTNPDVYRIFSAKAGGNLLTFTAGTSGALSVAATPGSLLVNSGNSFSAGGTTGLGFLMSAITNFGIFFGAGAPTLSAAKGSLYLRSDGSATNNRLYVNTDGSTGWTNVTTGS